MPAPTTTWDVRIVNVSDLSVVAYIPQFESCEFADSINDFGHGAVTFDRDASWIDDFYTANSNKYPWEGNYAVQILRSGSVAYTFVIEETEVEYAGETRQVVLGGRGLAACLTWGIVLPEGFNEANADPDAPDQVMFMGRGFGKTHDTQEELDAGTYSTDWPKHRAYGGGAFVHLFNEADTGNAGSWANITDAQASRNGGAVTWPLSLHSSMSRTNDANGDAWSSGSYSSVNVTWLFEIASGLNMHDTLLECCSLQDNAQWNVSPTGVISIAKSLGTDRSSEVLLTVPQSQGSRNSLRNTDTRSRLYASNGYLFEAKIDSTTVSRFGRREGFLDTDQAKGETVGEAAQQGLNEVKDELDEFTFAYQETDSTVAFVDFQVSDSVSIEYEPGIIQNRQITGLGASIASDGVQIEVVVGDIVDNAIAILEKKRKNEAFSALLTSRQAMSKNQIAGATTKAHLDPPTITSTEVQKDGTERSVKINFKTPGWADQSGSTKDAASQAQMIAHFDAEAYVTSTPTTRYNAVKSIDRTTSNQDVTISNLGTKDGGYTGRVRAVGQHGEYSDWADTTFTLTEATEGGASDPYKPDQVTGLSLFAMLNAILVKFTDFTGSTNPTISGSRGKYQIQISNASGGFNETSGNNWQWNINSEGNAGESGAACKNFTVPDGSGFLCGNLKSTSPGTVHYVRVRCLNWDGTAGDWSGVSSVTLDSANKSQVGVMIGEDSIAASHILAATITATEIASGTITADRLDADQVITSAIRMPQPPGANNAGELEDGSSGNEVKFNIDNAGNMWWGNYDTFADAESRTPISGTVGGDDVANKIKADGSKTEFGTPNAFMAYGTYYGITGLWSTGLRVAGATKLYGTLTAGTSDNFKVDNTGQVFFGSTTSTEGRIRIKPTSTNYLFTGSAIEFVQTEGQSGSDGWLQGGTFTMNDPVSVSVTGISMGSGSAGTTYLGVYDPSSTTTFSIVLNSPSKPISFKSSGGITIHDDPSAQSTTANRLSAYGGNLYWGDGSTATQLNGGGGSGDYSFNLDANNASSTEIEDGETINFNGLNLTTVSRGANQINIDTQKTISTLSDTGKKGIYLVNGSAANTTVGLNLDQLDVATPWDGSNNYVPWAYNAFGSYQNQRVSTSNLATHLANQSGFTSKYVPIAGGTFTNAFTWNNVGFAGTALFSIVPTFASHIGFSNTTSSNFYNAYHSGFQLNQYGTVIYRPGGIAQYNVNGANVMYQQTRPVSDNAYDLGNSSQRWDTIYAAGGITTSSDEALKTDIVDETKGVAFLKTLRPITFKWKSTGDHQGGKRPGARNHHGFIAQEIETALGDDAANDGLWVHGYSPTVAEVKVTDPEGNESVAVPAEDESYNPALRYTEFIGPIVKAIQELAARVETLEGG